MKTQNKTGAARRITAPALSVKNAPEGAYSLKPDKVVIAGPISIQGELTVSQQP